MTQAISIDVVRAVLAEACPGIRVGRVRPLDAGFTSRQWVADTDEGPVLVKTPVRETDPEHLRRLIATTRRAAAGGVPVVRFRAFLPWSTVFRAPVLVQEFEDGMPADAVWDDLEPVQRRQFAADLGRLVGGVHACSGPWFGDVLGTDKYPDARAQLHALVDARLGQAPVDLTSVGRAGLAAAFRTAIDDTVPADDPPSLTHGDLWRPNVILREGRIGCLLDFEHGLYTDRFLDFGKLDEHVFTTFPEGRAVFLEAYAGECPLPDGWPARVRLGNALHALSMSVYFLRWTPQYAPQYVRELQDWVGIRS